MRNGTADLLPQLQVEHRWEIRHGGWGLWTAKWVSEIELTPEREAQGYDLSDTMTPLEYVGEVFPWTLSALTRRGLERRMSRFERKHGFIGKRVRIHG